MTNPETESSVESSDGVFSGSGDSHQSHETPNAVVPGSIEDLEGSTRSIGRFLPSVGDHCIVDGQLVEITTFDTAANLFTAEMQVNNSVNRVTGHISNTRFFPLENGRQVVTTDGLKDAQRESAMVHSPEQETVDEGLARITASQGNEFTSYAQQHLLAYQPQAGDTQDEALRKLAGEPVETASDSESVDPDAPAEATDSSSESTAKSE